MINNNISKKILLSSIIAVTITLLLTSSDSFASPIGDEVDITFGPNCASSCVSLDVPVVGGAAEGNFLWEDVNFIFHNYLIDIEENTINITEQNTIGATADTELTISDIQWIDPVTGFPEPGKIMFVDCTDLITMTPATVTFTDNSITITVPASFPTPADIFCIFETEHEEPPEPDALFLLIDGDSIDNGNPPNFFEDGTINDDIADIGLRTQLPFFAANVGEMITLHTGEVGDEGWFALKTIPASWDAAGPTADGLRNFFLAGPGLGTEDKDGDRESLLDKIPDVTPLRFTGLKLLEGEGVCAVVYDGDISINFDPLEGNLKGDNLGTVAFKVISVNPLFGLSSSSLPEVEIEILDAEKVCEIENADLSITKSADVMLVKVGDTIEDTINVTNNGPDTAVNVIVADTLPSEVTFVSSSPTETSQVGQDLTWNLGDIQSNTFEIITLTVTVNDGVQSGTTISNIATVTSDTDDPDDTDNETPPTDTEVVPPEAGFCSDGKDNDGDGFTDCTDPDCKGDPACEGEP